MKLIWLHSTSMINLYQLLTRKCVGIIELSTNLQNGTNVIWESHILTNKLWSDKWFTVSPFFVENSTLLVAQPLAQRRTLRHRQSHFWLPGDPHQKFYQKLCLINNSQPQIRKVIEFSLYVVFGLMDLVILDYLGTYLRQVIATYLYLQFLFKVIMTLF